MLLSNLNLLATAPGGVARLRELILTLAVQGKLVPQDTKDEPANELLKKIRTEKDRLIAEGKIKRDKPLAEIAEEEKPFGLPRGWEWARLGDLCSYIQRGKGPVYADHSEHRVISQKCVRWYGLNLEPARFVTAESLTKYEAIRFLQTGDLLWNSTGTGTIGRACLVPPAQDKAELVADSHVTVVRPVQLNAWFLWRWIQSPYVQNEIEGSASGTTNQIELNTSTVVNHPIPVPPLVEQSRIVTRVEELMRLCDALEAKAQLAATQHAQLVSTLLATLTESETPAQLADNWHRIATHFDLLLDRPEAVDALEQTILQLAVRGLLSPQVVGDPQVEIGHRENSSSNIPPSWSQVSFEDVLLELRYGTSVKCGYDVVGTPVLRIPNLTGGGVDITDLKFGILEEREKEKLRLERGDLLIIRSNGSVSLVGSAALVSTESEGFAFAGYLVRARFRREYVEPTYLVLVMQTIEIRAQIEAPIRTTSGVKNINSTEISRLTFALPPLAEQSRIVTRVAQLRRLCADLRQRLSASQSTQAHLAEALVQEVA